MTKIDFEKSLARLEQLVSEMEAGELSLDQMLAKFKEGMKLADVCSKRLSEAERTVEVLIKGEDGSFTTEPFPEQAGTVERDSVDESGDELPF